MSMNDDILENKPVNSLNGLEPMQPVGLFQFALLSVATFGLYEVWWTYKCWKYFKLKDQSDIVPVGRAIFGIIFLFPLFSRIRNEAHSQGYVGDFVPGILFIGYLIFNILAQFPPPWLYVSVAGFICFLPVVNAFNYSLISYSNVEQTTYFNNRQLALLVLGSFGWVWLISYI